jgi:hypothetical protein
MPYAIAQGIQVSLDGNTWYKLTDHNRQPIGITYNLIESTDRMANGTLRKFVVARKFVISADWKDLPTLDSNLVDYDHSQNTVNTNQNNTPAPTQSYVPPQAIVTSTFNQYASIQSNGSYEINIIPTVKPPVGTIVSISGMTNSSYGYLQNGTYTITYNDGNIIGFMAPTVSHPANTGLPETVSGTMTWNTGIQITSIRPGNLLSGGTLNDSWFSANIDGVVLASTISVGDRITIYGSNQSQYNGVFTVSRISGNNFLVSGFNSGIIYIPSAVSDNMWFLKGSYTSSTPNPTVTPQQIQSSSSGPFGGAWIKSFYEGNYGNPIYVKLIFANEGVVINGLPDGNYVDSQNSGLSTNQVYEAFMSTFTYNVTKRRIGPIINNKQTGYDYVDLKIEFTEI